MQSFIKKAILFSLYFLLIFGLVAMGYIVKYKITLNDIPAPHLSDSFSLNEKMEFLRKNKKEANIIAIGSSICLNNIHSETIVEKYSPETYLNTSSWGMNMEDNYLLLKMLCEIHVPAQVIIASNISEFQLPPKKTKYSILKNYVVASNFSAAWYHLKCFNLSYYVENFKYAKTVRSSKDDYAYLVYDKSGGVNLDDNNFKINKQRFNTDFETGKIIENNYYYIDSISAFCKTKHIALSFFQSPFRQGLYSKFDEKKLKELDTHVRKIETILKRDGHFFVNSNTVLWDDNLFVDGEHLNTTGAKAFTEYCLGQTLKFKK